MGLPNDTNLGRKEIAVPVVLCNTSGIPAAITEDGELWGTRTETENDVWASFIGTLSASFYGIMVSKDNSDFPHKKLGQDGERLDITNIYFILDIGAGASGTIRMGIIRRIDGTDADIDYFMYLPFEGGVAKSLVIQQLNGGSSQLKTDISNGGLLHGITNNSELNVAAVNTVTLLPSPGGNIIPGLGDLAFKYEHGGGTTNVNLFVFYHNNN